MFRVFPRFTTNSDRFRFFVATDDHREDPVAVFATVADAVADADARNARANGRAA